MDWTLEVVVLPVSDLDAAAVVTVQQVKVRAETPLIPVEHSGRFGA